ncbi:MAG: branched-chain amino acid transaminase [Acidobacteria bacterium]|nr:branched-chain amino acid transaminase [Acidobacteriota bacterium]MBA3886026.1 branched-chain amino acid transaminase [Acidobacteriota bacterium]
MSTLTWMDGRLVPESQAVVPFLTAGLHYGMGVFEGIRCYDTALGPAVFRLDDHVERLLASARILGFGPLPYDATALSEAVHETVAANHLRACYIRPLIYLADGGMNLSLDTGRPRVGIAAWAWHDYHGGSATAGIRVNVSSYTRHHPNAMPTHAKVAGNYVNSFLAKTECSRLGFDDAVMLDTEGFVSECTGENLFLVRRGTIFTPPVDSALSGITRDTVMALAGDLSLRVVEERLVRDRLYSADEVFICGTAAEVVGVREIDMRPVGDGAVGPLTAAIQREFREVVSGRHARSAGWLSTAPERPVSGTLESQGVQAPR